MKTLVRAVWTAIGLYLATIYGAAAFTKVATVSWSADTAYNQLSTRCSTGSNQCTNGDTMFNTWCGNDGLTSTGEIFITQDDTCGYNTGTCSGAGSGLSVASLTASSNAATDALTALTLASVNPMTSSPNFGVEAGTWSGIANSTVKNSGLLCIYSGGTNYLFMFVNVLMNGPTLAVYGPAPASQLLVSTNGGASWTPTTTVSGGKPVPFSTWTFVSPNGDSYNTTCDATQMSWPTFVQYPSSQGYAAVSGNPDGQNSYVYLVGSGGCSDNNTTKILACDSISDFVANASADTAAWSYYTGGGQACDPTHANGSWSGTLSNAVAIRTSDSPRKFGGNSMFYVNQCTCYVIVDYYQPGVNQGVSGGQSFNTVIYVSQAPHPWGPWTIVPGSRFVNNAGATANQTTANPAGLYYIEPVAGGYSSANSTMTIVASGDFNAQAGNLHGTGYIYQPHFFRLTFTFQ